MKPAAHGVHALLSALGVVLGGHGPHGAVDPAELKVPGGQALHVVPE